MHPFYPAGESNFLHVYSITIKLKTLIISSFLWCTIVYVKALIYLSKMDKTEVILIKVSSVKYFQHTKRHHQQYKPVEHQMIVYCFGFL